MQPTAPFPQAFHVFDPDEYQALTPRGLQYQIVLRRRGRFEARRRFVASESLVASCAWTTPGVTHRTGTGPWASFTLVEDGPSRVVNGQLLRAGALARYGPGAEVHSHGPVGVTWWNMCFPPARLEAAGTALLGMPCLPPKGTVEVVSISPERHRSLVAGVSAVLSGREYGTTLVDGLLRLVLETFTPAGQGEAKPERGRAGGRLRQVAVASGLADIADEAEAPRSLVEICTELGVSLRTLNACSNAVLGTSAGAYLRRRRLHRVQSALRSGAAASVTEAATAQGFWELGRFAGEYRTLFGETPSATLRRRIAGAAGELPA